MSWPRFETGTIKTHIKNITTWVNIPSNTSVIDCFNPIMHSWHPPLISLPNLDTKKSIIILCPVPCAEDMEWSPNTEYWAQIITELERKSYPSLISAHTSYSMVVLPYCWLQTIHLSIISQRDSVLLDSMLSSVTTTVINQMLGFSAPCSLHRALGRVLFSQIDVMYASYKKSSWKKQNNIINLKLYAVRNQQM